MASLLRRAVRHASSVAPAGQPTLQPSGQRIDAVKVWTAVATVSTLVQMEITRRRIRRLVKLHTPNTYDDWYD